MYNNFLELSKEVSSDQQITCICVLNQGLILPIQKSMLSSIVLLPSNDTLFAMHSNASNALLMFYLLLFQGLNSFTVFPPNMMAYANSNRSLDTQINIPTKNLPGSALIPFMDKTISIAEIRRMQEITNIFLSGELTEENFLEAEFSLHIPMIVKNFGSLEKAIGHGSLNYFGHIIQYEELINMYFIYKKGVSATEKEASELAQFKDKLYQIYNEHRDEMKRNTSIILDSNPEENIQRMPEKTDI